MASERKIVLAIDGSDQAEKAFDYYAGNLHREGNTLILIHAAEPPQFSSHQSILMTPDIWDQLMVEEKKKVKVLEDKYAEKMRACNMVGKIKAIFHSKAGELICEVAKEEMANMIVLGTRGLGTIRRTIMGSVSDYVVHHAHCPVVVWRN